MRKYDVTLSLTRSAADAVLSALREYRESLRDDLREALDSADYDTAVKKATVLLEVYQVACLIADHTGEVDHV